MQAAQRSTPEKHRGKSCFQRETPGKEEGSKALTEKRPVLHSCSPGIPEVTGDVRGLLVLLPEEPSENGLGLQGIEALL